MRDIEQKRFAAIDLGTHSTMLLICEPDAMRLVTEADEFMRITRLGEGVGKTGVLNDRAVHRTLTVLKEYVERLRYSGKVDVAVVATSAVRDAANGTEFLNVCTDILGVKPTTLSGDEESRFQFQATAVDLPAEVTGVSVDTGGGSTEISVGRNNTCFFNTSVDVGCSRITELFSLDQSSSERDFSAAENHVREQLMPVCEKVRSYFGQSTPQVVFSGGTATSYAAMKLALLQYNREAVQGYQGSVPQLQADLAAIKELSISDLEQRQGVEPERAPVLPGGFLILLETLKLLGVDAFNISTRGLRFGLTVALAANDYPYDVMSFE